MGRLSGEKREQSIDKGTNTDAGDVSRVSAWFTVILPISGNYLNTQVYNCPGIINSLQG